MSDGQVITDVIDANTFPGGQLPDSGDFVCFLDGKKGVRSFGKTFLPDLLKRNDHTALKKYGQLLLKRVGKAFLCCDADLPEREGFLHLLDQEILNRYVLQDHRAFLLGVDPGIFHLYTAVQQAVPDQPQFLDLAVNDRQLVSQGNQAAVDVVMLHMVFDLIQGESDFFHKQDGIQIVNLAGAVVAVAIVRVRIGGTEQADLIVKDQRLL